jgi:hypothetical protein
MNKQPFEVRAGMYHNYEPEDAVKNNQDVLAEFAKTKTAKPLISLEDWNKRKWEQAHPPKTPLWNGVACPKCGKEMFDVDPDYILCSMPPQIEVGCTCGFRGNRFV